MENRLKYNQEHEAKAAAVLHACIAKANFMDGLSHLIEFMRSCEAQAISEAAAPEKVPSPIAELVKRLNEDVEYWMSWEANIAMAFKDQWASSLRNENEGEAEYIHRVANVAAKAFLMALTSYVPDLDGMSAVAAVSAEAQERYSDGK